MRRGNTLVALLLAWVLSLWALPIGGSPTALAQDGASIGVPTAVTDDEGTTVGSITVNAVLDPFSDFNPDYPPEAGSRFVAAIVAFDADAGQRFDITPYTIGLQDEDGFVWTQTSLILPDDALVPELTSQTLAPGSRVTGVIGFVVPEGSDPARILYQPESSRFVVLADLLNQPPPAIGEMVTIPDSEGGSGAVTVAEIVDPFEAYDPTYPPPDGSRFVLVTLVYENSGAGRFTVEPYGLLLRDANGSLWSATSVSRPAEDILVPDLRSGQLAPGDRISGEVFFAVPEGVDVAGVYLSPVSGQLLQLADARRQAGTQQDSGTSESAAAPVATPTTTEGDSASVTAEGPCAEFERWLEATLARIAQAGEMSVADARLDDEESLREHVAAYAELAEAQLAEDIPAGAEAVNTALAATFNGYSGAIDQILGANDPDKDTVQEMTEGMNTFNAAGQRIHDIEDELGRLAAECGRS
jgi:hypothetical protein